MSNFAFNRFILRQIMPFLAQTPIQYLQGKQHCQIAYRHFRHNSPSLKTADKKLIIFANGRAENLTKWSELAYNFFQKGYDVLVFDHRGQGHSQRLLADQQKGYIDEFRFYTDDMATLIKHINAQNDYQQQYLLAHSMGSLISAYYLANYDHHINKTVFCAPFFGVPLSHPIRDQLLINLMMLTGQGQRYIFGKGRYQKVDLHHNRLSHSTARMAWFNRINRTYPELCLGGPTFRWLHLSLNAIAKLPRILTRIDIPVLLLQAEQEQVVNNKKLPFLTAVLSQGELRKIANSKHEMLFERDDIRATAFTHIHDFLQP
ncbi:MAG: alpha/beta hydrolase [Pasteurellaceae bacterium]|nr:alpha/beta hydrolase [Pasteurellaceae bacterium]